MKLCILGGTGGTGKQIVAQALATGHEVTVLARDRAKVGPDHPRLRVIVGDLHNGGTVLADAMRGHDAVISAIGRGYSFKSEHLIERTVPVIIGAMKAAGVRRLVFTSAVGVGPSYADSPFMAKLFFRTLLRGIYADKLIGDQLIRQSGLDWTIVQPSQMTDGPLTRSYRSGERLALQGRPQISRADTAHFLLATAADPAAIGKTLLLSQ
jgi:putative NADH-flavin reductase